MNDKDTNAESPDEEIEPRVAPPQQSAGGAPAVFSSARHLLAGMGVKRGFKALRHLNQKEGFDCPGCAWPDPDDRRSVVEFCENGVKAVAEEATPRRVDPDFFRKWSNPELAAKSDFWLGQQGRLTHPVWLRQGTIHYEAVSWDTAFSRVAAALHRLSSPGEAIFYTSGRTSNEAAFLYQLFVRLFGTNNLPDCSNMCHESSGVALREVIGTGKGTVRLEDFEVADSIFVIGQNPGTNHPRMLTALQKAVKNGCRIVAINPLPEAGLMAFRNPQQISGWLGQGTPLASLFLQVRINGDVALLKGIQKALLEKEAERPGTVLDHDFIRRHTEGFQAFADDLKQTSWSEIERESGLSRRSIAEAAEIAGRSRRMIVCWAMGLTQHKNAVANIQSIVNLLLLGGHFGRAGAGACPVRGHSNVQGDRTMGIWESPDAGFLDALRREFRFTPPSAPGWDTVHAIEALLRGEAKVFMAMGGNFLSATPDTDVTAEALRRCELTVHVSTKLNRSHLVSGKEALILPCLARSDKDRQGEQLQFVSVENSMGIVHLSRGALEPVATMLKSEVEIVAGLAAATFQEPTHPGAGVPWKEMAENYDRIRERISRVIPGFENYNQRIRVPGGFYLPNPVRDHLEFRTEIGRARFTVHPIPFHNLRPGQYLMMTIRSHDQYNTTIYGLEDRYRGISAGRRVVLMNRQDLEEAGLHEKDRVDLCSHFDGATRWARSFYVVSYPIPRKSVATYFPEANVLVPLGSRADKSHTPTSKSVVVSVHRCE